MKKLLKLIDNTKLVSGLGAAFLALSFLDVLVFSDASNFSEMLWWGKVSAFGFGIVLFVLILRFFILPIGGWFINLFKKK